MVNVHRVVVIGMLASMLDASVALAQANPVAETLFRDGKRLVKDGKIAEACKAFEGSERLEHSVSTILSLADCREREGKLATAWGLFLQADSETRNEPAKATLNDIARKRATAIEGKLSYLTISVSDEARVPELVITRDDKVVDPAEWNRAIPVDNGEHVVAGKAPGHESWSTKISVGSLDKKSVEVPKFKVLADLAPKPPTPHVGTETRAVVPPREEPSAFTSRRKIALGIGIGGVAVAGVAAFFGASANGLRDDALARCPATSCTPDDAIAAQDLNDRARDRALYANISFGVAGAAVVGAAVLWFTGGPEHPPRDATNASRVSIAPMTGGISGISISGGF